MSELSTNTTTPTLSEIRAWLVERVALYLEVAPDQITPGVSLAQIGLDSVYAMTLSGDIEEQYGLELPPTVAWDHGTVDKLADFIAGELDAR